MVTVCGLVATIRPGNDARLDLRRCAAAAASGVIPSDVRTSSRLTRSISLACLSSRRLWTHDHRARMAITMARAGGMGVLHHNLSVAAQASQSGTVKRSEAGMVTDPVTCSPAHPRRGRRDVRALPDLRAPRRRRQGRSSSASSPTATCGSRSTKRAVADVMTPAPLITAQEVCPRTPL